PNGLFANLEVVASPTPELDQAFRRAIGRETENHEDRLASVGDQLDWMRDAGLTQVDCIWKWRGLALLVGASAREGGGGRSRSSAHVCLAREERIAEHLESSGVDLSARATEGIHRLADDTVDETGVGQHLLPPGPGQPTRNSGRPEIDVSECPFGDR